MKQLSFVPKFFCLSIFFLFTGYCSLANVQAQDEEPKDAAPPPLKILSKEEKKSLEGETNLKKRTQLSLDLMELRLKSAEEFAAQNKYQESLNELGGFQALLESALSFLEKNEFGTSKSDFNFKRLEIGLRRTGSRLELVRRELPFKYGFYVQKLQKVVREARAKAVEPLFGDSILPERKANQ
jgi:hypothetical protein